MGFLKQTANTCKAGWRILSLNCREASRLQSEGLGRALPLAQRLGLRIHLLLCQWCRRYGKQIRFLHHSLRAHPHAHEEAAPHHLSAAARQRLRQTLKRARQ